MKTTKISSPYAGNANKTNGQTLSASEWNTLSTAARDAQAAVNSIFADTVVLTNASQATAANKIYSVQSSIDLNGGTLTMPAGCTLLFEGGSISNGSLVLNNTRIGGEVSFSGVTISGSCANEVLTPQLFGAVGGNESATPSRDTKAFKNLAAVVDNAGTKNKVIHIPAGHYAVNEKIVIKSGCKVYGDGENTVIDLYDGAGGLYFGYDDVKGYYGSCELLNCNITQDASIHDTEILLDDVSEIAVGDYLIITDSADGSFHKSRDYYRTSEIVRVKNISENAVELTTNLFGNYYVQFGNDDVTTLTSGKNQRTLISKFTPESYSISDIRILSHGHNLQQNQIDTYYALLVCGLNNGEFSNIKVENYGNCVAASFRLCLDFIVQHCTFRSYTRYVVDDYALSFICAQNFRVYDTTLRAYSHALATGGDSSAWSINNRNFIYENLYFETSEPWDGGDVYYNQDLDVHSNSEYYKYLNIDAPHTSCDSGGYNVTIEGCRFFSITPSFNSGDLLIRNCEIMHSVPNFLMYNRDSQEGHGRNSLIIENSILHGQQLINFQDASFVKAYDNVIFRDNVCYGLIDLRQCAVTNMVLENNLFKKGLDIVDVECKYVSVKNNTITDGELYLLFANETARGIVAYNNINHDTLPAGSLNYQTVSMNYFAGIFANNVITSNIEDQACLMTVSFDSDVQIVDNVFKLHEENAEAPVVESRSNSKVFFFRNVHNSIRHSPVLVSEKSAGVPSAFGVSDKYRTYSDSNEKNIPGAIGNVVYIQRENKIGYFSIARKDDTKALIHAVNSETSYFGANPLTEGQMYYIAFGGAGNFSIFFSRYNQGDEGFEDGLLAAIQDHDNRPDVLLAPDPTVYPYIYITNSANSLANVILYKNRAVSESDGAALGVVRKGTTSQRPIGTDIYEGFRYYDTTINKEIVATEVIDEFVVWRESDGAMAGVARYGATSSRPAATINNRPNIYVGFMYNDTDVHKLLFASAIVDDVVTWVDADGNTVS